MARNYGAVNAIAARLRILERQQTKDVHTDDMLTTKILSASRICHGLLDAASGMHAHSLDHAIRNAGRQHLINNALAKQLKRISLAANALRHTTPWALDEVVNQLRTILPSANNADHIEICSVVEDDIETVHRCDWTLASSSLSGELETTVSACCDEVSGDGAEDLVGEQSDTIDDIKGFISDDGGDALLQRQASFKILGQGIRPGFHCVPAGDTFQSIFDTIAGEYHLGERFRLRLWKLGGPRSVVTPSDLVSIAGEYDALWVDRLRVDREHAALADSLRAAQRSVRGVRRAWHAFCDQAYAGRYEPTEIAPVDLRRFLESMDIAYKIES